MTEDRMGMDPVQWKLFTLLKEFKLTHTDGDLWSQGVKDGIRKCMMILEVEDVKPCPDRIEPVIQAHYAKYGYGNEKSKD